MAERPVERARQRTRERVEQARLTTRRLLGLDRSGPPPPETLAGHPLHPWTIPNAIGFLRLALIPVFLVLAMESHDGQTIPSTTIFAVVAGSDYLDGLAARLTGQYSRLGALLDPVVDRLLVLAGVAVCWRFDLLPRWALAALLAREVAVVALARIALRRGLDLKINWPGRLAVWPTMSAIAFALMGATSLAEVVLYVGLALGFLALAMYFRAGISSLRS
ncbi:MAG: CDP-alcohol phosphatidyltransferase family protein [Actinomycetota bacterium]|nr:CDP-alcohol phosphatidyltransferase family protein [Actinomycetota bacterium]